MKKQINLLKQKKLNFFSIKLHEIHLEIKHQTQKQSRQGIIIIIIMTVTVIQIFETVVMIINRPY